MNNQFIKNQKIKFKCQGSSNCCVSRGSIGYVYLSIKDRKRLANYKKKSLTKFLEKFCKMQSNYIILKNKKNSKDCIFLKEKKCSVYNARPEQCRTWPFWPENMNAKSWKKNVVDFCPGINKGKIYSINKINKIIKKDLINNKNIIENK